MASGAIQNDIRKTDMDLLGGFNEAVGWVKPDSKDYLVRFQLFSSKISVFKGSNQILTLICTKITRKKKHRNYNLIYLQSVLDI